MSETARIWSHNLALGLPAHGFPFEHQTIAETDRVNGLANRGIFTCPVCGVIEGIYCEHQEAQTSRVGALRGRA